MFPIFEEVEVINICDLPFVVDYIHGRISYEQSCDLLREYCAKNHAHYYARVREDFSVVAAAYEAKDLGFSKVVVEDLS